MLKIKEKNLKNSKKDESGEKENRWSVISLAWELGYLITIPIVLLAFGGKLLDDRLGTSPWILLVGIIFSIIITSWLVYKKVNAVIKNT